MKTLQTLPLLGDCRQVLQTLDDNSIDLIITSPPYADQRKQTYGGVHPDDIEKLIWLRFNSGRKDIQS